MTILVMLRRGLPLLAAAVLSLPAWADTTAPVEQWERNNSWAVDISNQPKLQSPLFATLRQAGAHWEIDGLFEAPPSLARTEKLELFMVTRDLQQWSNAYTNSVVNCDSFEAREADFHSVCTSTLSEKQSTGAAVAGLFFGGSGKRPVAYNRDKVAAAIHSIRIEQATAALTAFEQRKR